MQVLRCLPNQETVPINLTVSLGRGGEACVYTVPTDDNLVAKVYHKPTKQQARKLQVMLAHPPENPTANLGHISIAWPCELLKSADGSDGIIGFLMPRIRGMRPAIDFYNPRTRRQHCPLFNYHYLIRTARNLAATFAAVHASGYCVGDVNESNILVSDTALITLVDTDSFQVHDPDNHKVYRCQVGKPEFTPPELQNKTFAQCDRLISHDLFGLGVLLFQLLMEGTHPFSGIYEGKDDPPTYEARIASGHFTYSQNRSVPYTPTPIAPAWETIHPRLQELFLRCFEEGHNNPLVRPAAQTWLSALSEIENSLITCTTNSQHRYSNHLESCPWCERTLRLGGRDPFPSQSAVEKKEHLQPRIKRRKRSTHKPRSPLPQRNLPQHKYSYQNNSHHNYRQPVLPQHISYYKTRQKPKFYPIIFCLLGFGFLGFLDFQFTNRPVETANSYSQQNLIVSQPTNNLSFADYYQQGYAFYKVRNYRGAVEKFSLALQKNPYHSRTYMNRGNAQYNLRNYEAAIADYDRAIEINPNEFKAYVNRGNVRYVMAEYSRDPNNDYNLAIQDYNNALGINPQEVEAYIRRGMVRYRIAKYRGDFQPDFQSALEDLDQAIALNASKPEAFFQRGLIRYQIAQYSSNFEEEYRLVIQDFDQALQINSRLAKVYLKRGIVRYELAQYSGNKSKNYSLKAVEDLQTAAKIALEQDDMHNYQQAISSMCVIAENRCDSLYKTLHKK
ncbi:MAG: tetratricopeptide repeat protein [Nostocaceae cyanobacterium]|nr:tetratricopeptide repeat protein [Nostocaceae cyanobacterium]